MRHLTRSAQDVIGARRFEKAIPRNSKSLKNKLENLRRALKNLGEWERIAIDDAYGNYLDTPVSGAYLNIHYDNLINAINDILVEQVLSLQEGGRPRNSSAKFFALHCACIWTTFTGRLPPKHVNRSSPICKFVKAAMPRDVFVGKTVEHFVQEMLKLAYHRYPDGSCFREMRRSIGGR